MEAHESGWPHLHILMRSIWLDAEWLSDQMREISDSPIIKIKRIDDRAKINAYVAKYAGKAAHKFGSAKRYWQSPDYDLRPARPAKARAKPGEGWERQRKTIAEVVQMWAFFGYAIEWCSPTRALARPPPQQQASQ